MLTFMIMEINPALWVFYVKVRKKNTNNAFTIIPDPP